VHSDKLLQQEASSHTLLRPPSPAIMEPPPLPTARDTTSSSPSDAPPSFPKLEILDRSTTHHFLRPAKRINDGADVAHFLTSKAYRDIGTYVLQLNRAMCPRKLPRATGASPAQTFPLDAPRKDPEPVLKLRELLRKVEAIIDDAPLDTGPRRFGNIGFRTWHTLLEQRADGLLREYLPTGALDVVWGTSSSGSSDGEEAVGPLDELKAYFLGGFGSSQRLDFGTGHELSFLAFLGCLWKLGVFSGQQVGGEIPGAVERSIVLGVIEPYVSLLELVAIADVQQIPPGCSPPYPHIQP